MLSGSRPAAVTARGWGWRYAGRRSWAARKVDLQVWPGERILLAGPSGAGKSTLLAALAGVLGSTGSVQGGGEEEGELRIDGMAPHEARAGVGILFQDPDTQLVMARAGDDVAFGLENRGVPYAELWPRVDAALDAVAFPYARDRPTAELSGGERQRLALAGVLALKPRLLLLDEPTANLDPEGAARLRSVLQRIGEERTMTIVLVEHRVDEVVELVDRVVVLGGEEGVRADGRPHDVFARMGDELAARGVWVPGRPLPVPPQRPRPPTASLLLAEAATFRYPGAGAAALGPFDAVLRSSEALAVVGPNGSGKSTLALLLGGLLRPTAGAVLVGEALAAGHGREELWRWPARRLAQVLGNVFQDPEHQLLAPTVREELLIGPLRAGASHEEAAARADELLERLHLAPLAAAHPFTLSGGEKRRLSVATALATAPAALVLDEPTFGQDRRTWSELLSLLAGLRDAGAGIAFVTHDLAFARALADRTARLADGRLA